MPSPRVTRRPLIMLKTKGLLGPVVQGKSGKPATNSNRSGVRSTGSYQIYKQLNP